MHTHTHTRTRTRTHTHTQTQTHTHTHTHTHIQAITHVHPHISVFKLTYSPDQNTCLVGILKPVLKAAAVWVSQCSADVELTEGYYFTELNRRYIVDIY